MKDIIWEIKYLYRIFLILFYFINDRKRGNYLIKDNTEESLGYIKDFTLSKKMTTWTKNSEKAHIFYSKYEAYLYMFLFGNSGFCKIVKYTEE